MWTTNEEAQRKARACLRERPRCTGSLALAQAVGRGYVRVHMHVHRLVRPPSTSRARGGPRWASSASEHAAHASWPPARPCAVRALDIRPRRAWVTPTRTHVRTYGPTPRVASIDQWPRCFRARRPVCRTWRRRCLVAARRMSSSSSADRGRRPARCASGTPPHARARCTHDRHAGGRIGSIECSDGNVYSPLHCRARLSAGQDDE
jgi:hypothetical protein